MKETQWIDSLESFLMNKIVVNMCVDGTIKYLIISIWLLKIYSTHIIIGNAIIYQFNVFLIKVNLICVLETNQISNLSWK